MTKWYDRILRAGMIAAAAFVLVTVPAPVGTGPGPAVAQEAGQVPGGTLGAAPTSDFWRAIRQGDQGTVSGQNKQAGVLIQSEGDNWRAIRNGPLSTYGVWALAGAIGVVALFFLLRGRIRIEAGRSSERVTRFGGVERFGHWLTAASFIILGFSGLNMLYGRYFLKDLLGPEAFAQATFYGKLVHNYVAFAFVVGLVLILVVWIKDNLPSRTDIVWLLKGGGLLSRHSHPPAKKFNAGQKLIFWLVVLGGASLSLSGLSLMFPFEFPMFAKTFEAMNAVGFEKVAGFALPTVLTPMQEMQLSQLWHGVMALVLIAIIIAHIYIGTIGMEGAFDAMGSGEVDANWAREHHSIWYEKVRAKKNASDTSGGQSEAPQPAE